MSYIDCFWTSQLSGGQFLIGVMVELGLERDLKQQRVITYTLVQRDHSGVC